MKMIRLLILLLLAVVSLNAQAQDPSRFPNGVVNTTPDDWLRDLPELDPTRLHFIYADFNVMPATRPWSELDGVIQDATTIINQSAATNMPDVVWFVDDRSDSKQRAGTGWSNTGGALYSEAGVTNSKYGVLTVLTGRSSRVGQVVVAASHEDQYRFTSPGLFKLETGKKAWFGTRFKIFNVTDTIFFAGMQIANATPLSTTNGVYFVIDAGTRTVAFNMVASTIAQTTPVTGALVPAVTEITNTTNTTWTELSWYWNGNDRVEYFVDNVAFGAAGTTNLPTEELSATFGIINGATGARAEMQVDWAYWGQER